MKPWLEPTHHGVYSRLLRRLLIADDVAVRVPDGRDPAAAANRRPRLAERKRVNARERFRWHVREPLAAAVRGPRDAAAFYCVADERYFLGAVGLVNSLRLVGHREPIFLLDCGLDDEQRELLGREVDAGRRRPGRRRRRC